MYFRALSQKKRQIINFIIHLKKRIFFLGYFVVLFSIFTLFFFNERKPLGHCVYSKWNALTCIGFLYCQYFIDRNYALANCLEITLVNFQTKFSTRLVISLWICIEQNWVCVCFFLKEKQIKMNMSICPYWECKYTHTKRFVWTDDEFTGDCDWILFLCFIWKSKQKQIKNRKRRNAEKKNIRKCSRNV